MRRFQTLPLGIQLATAALAASIPRYVLAFLKADGIQFVDGWKAVEALLLVLSALATAITVTAGAAYVAHVAASAQRPLWQRAVLFAFWLPSLGFEVAILAPALLSTMRGQPLACSASALASSAASAPLCVLPAPLDATWSGIGIAACAYSAMLCVVAASLMPHSPPQSVQDATRKSDLAPLDAPHEPTQSDSMPPLASAERPLELAPVALKCDQCGRGFGTPNALRAHKRFCVPAPVVSTNGNGAH